MKIVPDSARDFNLNPITSSELAAGAVTTGSITDGAVTPAKIENAAVTMDKLSENIQSLLSNAENAIQEPIASSGDGAFITDISVGADNKLQVQTGNAVKTLAESGSGNAVASLTLNGTELIQNKGTLLASVSKTGTGNALTDVSTDGSGNVSLASDTFLKSVEMSGTGNVITGLSAAGGVLTGGKGNHDLIPAGRVHNAERNCAAEQYAYVVQHGAGAYGGTGREVKKRSCSRRFRRRTPGKLGSDFRYKDVSGAPRCTFKNVDSGIPVRYAICNRGAGIHQICKSSGRDFQ